MSRLGGMTQLGGSSQFGGVPTGYPIEDAVDRMLGALEALSKSEGGTVRTLDILSAPITPQTDWSLLCTGGLPGILVGYSGSAMELIEISSWEYEQTGTFQVLVIADSLHSRRQRLAGVSVYGSGLWTLLSWSAFLAGRALTELSMLRRVRPVREDILSYGPEYFAGLVTIEATWLSDLYPDAADVVGRLRRIGIVHTPTDLEDLFESDNLTPKTTDPTSLPGPGVAELSD